MLLWPSISLIFSAFIAGILMFLAPCTLPLVPGYLAFIGGVQESEVGATRAARNKVIINGLSFSLGFTLIFVIFGVAAGFAGGLVGPFKTILIRIAGIVVVLFGLVMLNALHIPFLSIPRNMRLPTIFIAGEPKSSFIMGGAFALGWTPCVGPVLATVLLLASVSATAFYGGFLLLIFSLGLSIPFMAVAFAFSKIAPLLSRYQFFGEIATVIGGVFLILIGVLLLTQYSALALLIHMPPLQFLQNFY